MGSLLLVMFVAVANLALGAGVAIATGAAPPLREIVDGVIYERDDDDDGDQEDNADNKNDADRDATQESGNEAGECDSAG